MSIFTVESLPASFGDALWIEYGEEERIHRVLVDGGVAGTFAHIERKLSELGSSKELDLVMVTHVDEDHIAGSVRLLGSVKRLGLQIGDLWFNGRDHLEGGQVVVDQLGAKQGEFLASLISKQGLNWNRAFSGRPVEVPVGGALPSHTLPGGMRLTLLSPGRAQLEAMISKWDKDLHDVKPPVDWTDVDEVLAFLQKRPALKPSDALGSSRNVVRLASEPFVPDTAEANGTSIAILAEFAGRAVLLGADAHAPVLSASIDRLLAERGIDRLRVHLFKIPHHGSAGNLSIDLLSKVDCGHYLISTNGQRYRHPDREAIARIVRHGGTAPTIHFNYRSEYNVFWDNEELGQGIDYHANYPAQEIGGCIVDVAALTP